jgi:hypothetical protein
VKQVAPTPAPKVEANQAAPAPAAQAQPAAAAQGDQQKKAFPPGLLNIKLLETRGLKMPPDCTVVPGGPNGKDIAFLPLAVIEIDKNEVMMRSVEANPANQTVLFQTKANL